jgi:two-component system, OmpR family, copper resistance phosphate regulon response regulator CusR
MRILLVEEEPSAARMLSKGLREHTYAVDVAVNGEDAMYRAAITDYDAIILDVMLPMHDGLDVCRQLRHAGSTVPVLMVTARDGVDARIAGLDSGADDYLTKPFDLGELLARLRAVIRRGRRPLTPTTIRSGGLEIDRRARLARKGGRTVALTAREYALLEFFMLHVGEVVGRADISEHVWDDSYDPLSNVIDVYVQRLRRKLDERGAPSLIQTRRGEGYMLTSNSPREAP